MRVSASPYDRGAATPALLLALAGIAVLLLALILLDGDGATDGGQPPEDTAAGAPTEVAPAGLEPGTLRDPQSLEPRPPPWAPEGVQPPDSAVRSGVPPTHALLRGRVLVPEWAGWPRRAVLVLTRQRDGAEVARAEVGEESPEYRFAELPFDDYRLRVEADEFEPLAVLLTASAAHPDLYQSLPLTPAASVAGRVLDQHGLPVADLAVCAEWLPKSPADLVMPHEGRTGADGTFRIPGLRGGEYDVYPGPPRTPIGERKAVFVGPGAPQAWVELQVPAMGAAHVRLEDLDSAGLAGVRVEARMTRAAGAIGAYVETRSPGADGVVAFGWLPPGEYGFTAFGGAFRRIVREATVLTGQTADLRMPLRPAPQRGAQR